MLRETLSQGLKISQGKAPVSRLTGTSLWKISQGKAPVSRLTGTLFGECLKTRESFLWALYLFIYVF